MTSLKTELGHQCPYPPSMTNCFDVTAGNKVPKKQKPNSVPEAA